MATEVDNNEIKQITSNVYKKSTEIYIPCLKTYNDVLGEENNFSDSSEIFFEFAALQKSKGVELKYRVNPIRVFRTSPISDCLLKIAKDHYESKKLLNISNAVRLVFSGTESHIFESVMPPQLSIFEKALILKEECGDSANITIISNDENIDNIKKQAEEESGKTFTDEDFKLMNTDELIEERLKQNDLETNSILFNLLKEKKEIKIGDTTYSLPS